MYIYIYSLYAYFWTSSVLYTPGHTNKLNTALNAADFQYKHLGKYKLNVHIPI